MKKLFKRSLPLVLVGTVAFIAGNATAADPMLADAQDQIHKAIYNVQDAENEEGVRRFERKKARTLRKLCVADYIIYKMQDAEYSQPEGSPCWEILGIPEPTE